MKNRTIYIDCVGGVAGVQAMCVFPVAGHAVAVAIGTLGIGRGRCGMPVFGVEAMLSHGDPFQRRACSGGIGGPWVLVAVDHFVFDHPRVGLPYGIGKLRFFEGCAVAAVAELAGVGAEDPHVGGDGVGRHEGVAGDGIRRVETDDKQAFPGGKNGVVGEGVFDAAVEPPRFGDVLHGYIRGGRVEDFDIFVAHVVEPGDVERGSLICS